LENDDTMGERMGRIGQIETDFFLIFHGFQAHAPMKKSVRIRPIRPIRSPIVSPFAPKKLHFSTVFVYSSATFATNVPLNLLHNEILLHSFFNGLVAANAPPFCATVKP
jgi:hypothetical protein